MLNDLSAHNAQFSDGQYFRGRRYDTFSLMGPMLVTGGFYPNAVDVNLRVNGETKQSSNTEKFNVDVGDLVAHSSRVMTLRPSDVITTDTPGGVGIFRNLPEFLESGITVEAEIEGIGVLENCVVAE